MRNILEIKGVSKYFGGLKAVEAVDINVEKGDIYGIIGPNGAGKTTLFDVCSGFLARTKGEILLDGENITNLPPNKIALKGISRTFQNIKLFSNMTVLDNVKIGFHIKTKVNMFDALFHTPVYKRDEKFIIEKGNEILKQVGLTQYADTLAGNLAYGIQRKVEIARAIALEPKILLLDEPAAGMNPIETKELMELVKKLSSEGYTLIIIEHDMKFIMNTCKTIAVLNYGQKICEGTPEQVSSDKNVLEAYFGTGMVIGQEGENTCFA